MKGPGTLGMILVVILGLLIMLYAFFTTWDSGNKFASAPMTGVYYSPNEEELDVQITMTEAGDVNICVSVRTADSPLALIQELSVSKLRLQTAQTEYILDGQYDEKMLIEDGEGNMTISFDAVPSTEYQLIITELTGYAKAEGPLYIQGNWTN